MKRQLVLAIPLAACLAGTTVGICLMVSWVMHRHPVPSIVESECQCEVALADVQAELDSLHRGLEAAGRRADALAIAIRAIARTQGREPPYGALLREQEAYRRACVGEECR